MNLNGKSKYLTSLSSLLGVLVMSLMVNQVFAAPVYTFSSTPDYMDGAYTFEQRFVVGSQGIVIDSLGFYDYQGNGLAASHLVGIFDAGGTLLTSTTIGAGTGSTLQYGFRWQDIADIFVAAGSTISLVAQSNGDPHNMTPGLVLDPRMVSVEGGYVGGTIFDPNQISTYPDNMIWVANFNITEVPEPASLALLGLGLAGLGFSRRKSRKLAA